MQQCSTTGACPVGEPEFMTTFVTWQLRVTLDNIRNSCNVQKRKRGRLKLFELFEILRNDAKSPYLVFIWSKWTNLGLTKSEVWESIQGNFGAVEQLCANLSQKWILPKSKFHRRRRAALSVWFTLILQNLAASSVGRHHAVLHWRHQISICYLDWTANSL